MNEDEMLEVKPTRRGKFKEVKTILNINYNLEPREQIINKIRKWKEILFRVGNVCVRPNK